MRGARSAASVALGAVAFAAALAPATGAAATRDAEAIPGRYVVVYDESVQGPAAATAARERAHGFRARHRYSRALKGFAASLNSGQVRALQRDPAVELVVPDRPVRAAAAPSPGETVPPGIRRIGAASPTTAHGPSGVAVAVIDSGIALAHPDLAGHAVDGTNCIDPGRPAADDNGHGTHVAGTVAAANTGSGVLGVAPGTTLYAVKVLDAEGNGSTSSVVCGIEWVTDNAAALGIRVANMSLGGPGTPVRPCATTIDPEHRAICASTAAGVAYTVAAGNDGWDFDYAQVPDVPAAYPEVLAVTSMNDSDGLPGAFGARCELERDDRFSSFSNYAATAAGAAHSIAAPGNCVLSTSRGGGLVRMSGTSMAAPHVAGALALCFDEAGAPGSCAGRPAADPVGLIDELTGRRSDRSYGFTGDPNAPVSGRHYGHLLWVPPAAGEAECTVVGTPGDDRLVGTPGDDVICGLGGNDDIRGGDGRDVLRGGDGKDALYGQGGTDALHGDAGSDALDGGAGADTFAGGAGERDSAQYSGRRARVELSLNGIADDGQADEGDMIGSDVERLVGGEGDDMLSGDGGADELRGRGGDDRLAGGPGRDRLYGEAGSDTLDGLDDPAAADALSCGDGVDPRPTFDSLDAVAADCE